MKKARFNANRAGLPEGLEESTKIPVKTHNSDEPHVKSNAVARQYDFIRLNWTFLPAKAREEIIDIALHALQEVAND